MGRHAGFRWRGGLRSGDSLAAWGDAAPVLCRRAAVWVVRFIVVFSLYLYRCLFPAAAKTKTMTLYKNDPMTQSVWKLKVLCIYFPLKKQAFAYVASFPVEIRMQASMK